MSFFSDLKIIDASTVLAGPSVGMFFAEMGAEVIKVEHPKHKDVTRTWKLKSEDKNDSVSAYFSSINYKKSYRYLDLKDKTDNAAFLDLVETADVVLMNFKKGDQEKFGLADSTLKTKNKRLIIGKINGFGAESDRVAYDLILQAETGFMSMNGTPESGPVKMPVALIDVLAGHQLKEGLLAALLERTQSEVGQTVTVSLYESAVSSLMNQASNYLMEDFVPKRIGSLHPNIAPYGEIFKTQDSKHVTFAIGSQKQFEKLCTYFRRVDLITNKHFKNNQNRIENRIELHSELEKEISTLKCDVIIEYCNTHFIPAGEIKSLDEVFKTSLAKGLIREEVIDSKNTKRVSSIAFKVNR